MTKAKIKKKDLISPEKLRSKLRRYKKKTKASYLQPLKLSEAGYYPETYLEVEDFSSEEVETKIEQILLRVARSILNGRQDYAFTFPSRASKNSVFLQDVKRFVLKYDESRRSYTCSRSTEKTVMMAKMLQIVYRLLRCGVNITKRDLFYTDVKLFKNQTRFDGVLEDIACMIGCTKNSLHVITTGRGVIIGRLILSERGDRIDCRKMGFGGKSIPPNTDCIEVVSSKALFILIVDKDSVFFRLAEDRFYEDYPCIIVAASGYPDVGTRSLVKKLATKLKIPVFALTDGDPHGLSIVAVYSFGSKNMPYDSWSLATPSIVWLGLKPGDLDTFGVPTSCRLPMTSEDVTLANSLLKEAFVMENADWARQLQRMMDTKEKAEIQCLSNFHPKYLTKVYLPKKLDALMSIRVPNQLS